MCLWVCQSSAAAAAVIGPQLFDRLWQQAMPLQLAVTGMLCKQGGHVRFEQPALHRLAGCVDSPALHVRPVVLLILGTVC
jgi:hypothetical protein